MPLPQSIENSEAPPKQGVFNFKKLMAKTAVHLGIKLEAKGFFLDIAVSPEIPRYFHGDPQLVEKIVHTLVGHSMKCLDNGGITIRINTLDFTAQGNHRLVISINESSHGMMPEEVQTINQSLQEQQWQDTDGTISPHLCIAAKWIQSLGGHLTIESVFGWGTRYLITLNLCVAGCDNSCLGAA